MAEHLSCDTLGAQVAECFPEQVKGKTFVISGLIRGGLAATAGDNLAHGGAGTIIFTGRSQLEGQSVASHINRKHPRTKITFIAADTSKLASVYEAAKTIKELSVQIDGIIGIPTVVAGPWEITEDGVESHFQRNYLCFFVFVTQLMEALNPGSRVVLMTTSVRQEVPAPKWDNVNFSNGECYHPLDAYTLSAFANIMFAKSLAQKYPSIGTFSANPGNTKNNFQTYVSQDDISSWLQRKKEEGEELPILLQQAPKSLAQASATVLRGLLDPTLNGKFVPNPPPVKWSQQVTSEAEQSGAFLDNGHVLALPYMDFPQGEDSAAALWQLSEKLVAGIEPEKR